MGHQPPLEALKENVVMKTNVASSTECKKLIISVKICKHLVNLSLTLTREKGQFLHPALESRNATGPDWYISV